MTEQKNAEFKKALTQAALSRYQAQMDVDQEPVVFSEAHIVNVKELTNKTQRKTWKYVNSTAKRILIVAIIFMLLTTTAFATIPALRDGLIRFFMRDNGVAYSFVFTQEDYEHAPREIETYYTPTWVPSNYIFVSEKFQTLKGERIYVDGTGNYMVISQYVLWQEEEAYGYPHGIGKVLTVTSENTTVETQIMQGYEVKILRIKEALQPEDDLVMWTDHNYFFMIDAKNIKDEEIDRIIGSMTKIEIS